MLMILISFERLPFVNNIIEFIIFFLFKIFDICHFDKNIEIYGDWGLGFGDWGIGDWGLGPIPNPQSPIPNPQSPIPI
jgi:hypothetical protein